MGRKVTMINELVNVAYKFYRLLNYRFPRKVHAVRIPPCGDFQRKEDNEIRNTLIRLCKNGNSSRVKTLILHGPAGHGKIYSAANLMDQLYSKPLRSRYFWNKPWNFRNRPTILWTINAKNEATMLESYCSLAKEIGLTEEAKVANQELSLLSRTSEGRQYHINLQNQCQENAYDEALKQIYEEVMKKLKHEGSWVLLIEGPKEDRSSHQQFWPQSGDPSFGNGLVIMTTESQKLRPEEGDDYPLAKVSIDKMTKEDAVRFFGKKSGIRLTGVDLKNAEFIAVKLANCIPQDIAKVAAFVREYKEETNKQLAFPGLPVPKEKTLFGYMMILELTRQNQTQLLKFLACCSSENYLPLEILKRGIESAVEAVKDSKYVDESTRNEIKVVTIHPRDHATLRDILSRQQSNNAEQTWKYFSKLPFFNEQRNINIAPLSCLDVSQVIACLSKVCKDALQRNRDKDFVLLRLILPHLKEAVQLSNKMKLEGEFEPHVMAIGHACLGEGLLIFGESEEARGNLETALNLFQNCRDEENVHLDVANVKHFLGEAFSNSHLGDPLQGISYLENALEEKERFYNGKEDPQIALTLQSLGNVLNELGKHSEAIFHIERALKIYRDSENFKQEYGFTISALGSSYRYLGQYSKAEDKLKKALKIFESVESPSELRVMYCS